MSNVGHDAYGKAVLRSVASRLGMSVQDTSTHHPITQNVSCSIDAVLSRKIAVEVESRTPKQVRGAILDLFWHPAPYKLMILLPAYIGNPDNTAEMCNELARRLYPDVPFRCVVLRGKGDDPHLDHDAALVAKVVEEFLV